ncbi:MAG TPA: selenocysteine-specific translation elongation factor [Candidatus Dormibacteraeota bacterium]|nr:selenocysteine-specific translation elongation factor [Candidatus Dormibacteraeota bacterium]
MSFVVGTAGHIDHGKSTLIEALTGIDPDRLAEEKRRGMTIDLGFAHMTLPSGREIGIVDVPGHARFMRNMLAGAHGLDAVLLVIAADEGVMPQTREHLDVIELLEVPRGIVVLTKVDLVESDWLELVKEEVRKSIKEWPIVSVSAVTGEGVARLVDELDALLADALPRDDAGRPRMPIDRVFTMSGFGTVVTGTLVDGTIRVGDDMAVMPSGRAVRVRGLQRHNEKVESVGPGNRVAANLTGVEKSDLSRGDVLAAPNSLEPTRRVDARVRVVSSAASPLRHGMELLLHTGTAEVPARLIVLEGESIAPGSEAWVQLYLARPIAVAAQDRFILRIASPAQTVAGGTLVDIAPRKHSRHDTAVRESLDRRAAGNVLEEELRKYPRGVTVAGLLKASVAPDGDVAALRARRLGEWIFSDDAWQSVSASAARELAAYHASFPLRPGMAREELRNKIGVSAAAFPAVVKGLVEDGRAIERNGSSLAAPGHEVAVDDAGLVRLLDESPLAPPSLAEAMQKSGVTVETVKALAQRGDIVRVSDDVAFSKRGFEVAVALVKEIIGRDGSVTVAELRDRMSASRRPVLALLEYLDAQHVTRRVGDARILR